MISLLDDLDLQALRHFQAESVSGRTLEKISCLARTIRRDILSLIDGAGSGHVGGALSSVDVYLMLWLCADSTPNRWNSERDRIVVSHGHTAAALYAVLGNLGFFDMQTAFGHFRCGMGIFEGHPGCRVPGVEWCSGSLGQGLSVGCGMALASKLRGLENRVYVVMGDGEHQKGQLTEAREFAVKYELTNLTAVVDVNRLQASGPTDRIMPGDLAKKYAASGWEVVSVDGHDHRALYNVLREVSMKNNKPVVILANTVMGKGVPAIENNFEYHGKLLSKTQYEAAVADLSRQWLFESIEGGASFVQGSQPEPVEVSVNPGNPIVYPAGKPVECRTAAGEAIYDLIKTNPDLPLTVVDCDLVESLKNGKVLAEYPEKFIECGIQEHHAATVSGALSKAGVLPFFMDFGVFGIDETYGQHRMNAVNDTSVKVIATHCGLDVGEDGKTHQCIDYIALMAGLPGYRLIIPADANQTDRVVRYVATTPGNFVVAMGRSKVPVLTNENGDPFYGENYSFSFGNSEWVKEGGDAAIITTGTLVGRAIQAAEALSAENIKVGVLNISCPGEINVETIRKACQTGVVVTYEDHLAATGLGSLVASVMAENGLACRFKKLGITQYGKSCSAEEQYQLQGLDAGSLIKIIRALKTM